MTKISITKVINCMCIIYLCFCVGTYVDAEKVELEKQLLKLEIEHKELLIQTEHCKLKTMRCER